MSFLWFKNKKKKEDLIDDVHFCNTCISHLETSCSSCSIQDSAELLRDIVVVTDINVNSNEFIEKVNTAIRKLQLIYNVEVYEYNDNYRNLNIKDFPALIINNKIRVTGNNVSIDEIVNILDEYAG